MFSLFYKSKIRKEPDSERITLENYKRVKADESPADEYRLFEEFYQKNSLKADEWNHLISIIRKNNPDQPIIWHEPTSQEEHKLSDVKAAQKAKQVRDYLFSPEGIDPNLISFRDIEERFKSRKTVVFFPSHSILETYFSVLNSPKTKAETIKGPSGIGKSFNLALFKLILSTNVDSYRVMYIPFRMSREFRFSCGN